MAEYHHVNAAWPEGTREGRDLKPTPQEALTAVRRLYRLIRKRPFRGKVELTSGVRYTGIRSGVLYANPDWGAQKNLFINGVPVTGGGGWHELVHMLSHSLVSRMYPNAKGHGHQHAFIEREMIQHVVSKGWLTGALKRPEKEKPKKDLKVIRFERVKARIAKWESRKRRAETALRKLRRTAVHYERTLAA